MLQYRKADIKAIIIILVLCAITLGVVFLFNRKSNYDNLEPVREYNNFLSNAGYVNSYVSAIAQKNSSKVYAMLDERYISSENITLSNVLDKTYNYNFNSSVKVLEMSYLQIGNNFVYYAEGEILSSSYDGDVVVGDFYALIFNDLDNLSYSIYPINSNDLKKVINEVKKIDIPRNDNNGINASSLISKEQVCSLYLTDFMGRLRRDVDKTYDLLSNDMKKSYPTLDEYRKYIKEIYSSLSTEASKCKMDDLNDRRLYTVIDKNNNTFIFNEEYIMKYTVNFYVGANE